MMYPPLVAPVVDSVAAVAETIGSGGMRTVPAACGVWSTDLMGWIDTAVYVDPTMARYCIDQGVLGVFRYLRRDQLVMERPDLEDDIQTLSRQELDELLTIGLQVGLVQLGAASERPTYSRGQVTGCAAAQNAKALGIPPGATIFVDLEYSIPVSPSEVSVYADAWGTRVLGLEYRPGAYQGPGCDLSAAQWWGLYPCACYWRSAARSVPLAYRQGCCVQQHFMETWKVGPRTFYVDRDDVTPDALGDLPWVVSA